MAPKILYQTPQSDNYQIYNKEVTFKLENYGLIKMIFLIFEISPSAIDTSFAVPTSAFLIQNVQLESFGNPIARNTTSYILGRLEELDGDIYDEIVEGSTLKSPFSSAQTIALPLFLWAIDGQMLDTFKYPNLTIRATTKDSHGAMGFGGDISKIDVKLKVIYDQQKTYVPVTLKNPYNVYRTITPVLAGLNSITIKLNVPYEVCNLYFMIRDQADAGIKERIKSVTLSSPTGIIGTYDNQTNYYLGKTKSANYGNIFGIQLGSRYKKDDYLTFNGQQNPTIAEITFDTLATNYNLYTAFEYYSNIVESKEGMLLEDVKGSFVRGF